jgi:hypothetical protein
LQSKCKYGVKCSKQHVSWEALRAIANQSNSRDYFTGEHYHAQKNKKSSTSSIKTGSDSNKSGLSAKERFKAEANKI